jgi:methionyl-tRNA synthetase
MSSKDRRKRLVTSALPYVNNLPHLGNVTGSILSADVFVRYSRMRGHETLFVCGTDEYGTASEVGAIQKGITPKELCSENSAEHKRIYDWFGVECDHFGRTSHPSHTETTQEIFMDMWKNSAFTRERGERLYCKECKMFLADRYVTGICAHCNSDKARGDQCDECGMVLKPEEVKDPQCLYCKNPPIFRETEHLFFHMEAFEEQIKAQIDERIGGWSSAARRVASEWSQRELIPRCITRDLRYKWGVPVPVEGFEEKVLYVWFDAPIGYISFTKALGREGWWISKDADLYEFMGKDNVFFHAVFFPAMLMATGKKFIFPKVISATNHVTYEGGKFSKSMNRGVFGQDLLGDRMGPSGVWRFHLMRSRPENNDTDFLWDEFTTTLTSFLINTIGNFCHRTLSFAKNKMGCAVGESRVPVETMEELNKILGEYNEAMEKTEIRTGANKVVEVAKVGNAYVQSAFANSVPLEEKKVFVSGSLNIVLLLGRLLCPFCPVEAAKLFSMLGMPSAQRIPGRFEVEIFPGDRISSEVSLLFTHLADSQKDAIGAARRAA